jgi:hypothetical protein
MVYLETRLREIVPPGTSNDAVRAELERQINHLGAAAHLLMVARLLSFNSSLIDPS